MIKYLLAPNDASIALDNLPNLQVGGSFSEERVEFVHNLSQTILTDADARNFPEIMAMAHWFRKAHLNVLKEEFIAKHKQGAKPVGTVFHIAPGNVDTLFMYSWLLSFLIGNHNIVRLSQRQNQQLEKIISYIDLIIPDKLRKGNFLLTYAHDDSITRQLTNMCNLRVIWGGDATVDHIQAIDLPADAKDITFRDRFSMAALDAETIIADSDKNFHDCIAQFYNDAFWFDQLACSSPRLVVWVGNDKNIALARDRFWPALVKYIASKPALIFASEVISRSSVMMHWSASGLLDKDESVNLAEFPAHVMLNDISDIIRLTHPGTGLFGELSLQSFQDLLPYLNYRDQTIAVYGFKDEDIQSFKKEACFDRVAQLGKALQFETVWDGVDFFKELVA